MAWRVEIAEAVATKMRVWQVRYPALRPVLRQRIFDLGAQGEACLGEEVIPLWNHRAFRFEAGGPGSDEEPDLPVRLLITFTVIVYATEERFVLVAGRLTERDECGPPEDAED